MFNGQTITTAGTFRDTLTTSLGCDSFIVLTVTVNPTPTTNISQELCNGQTVVFNGQTITTAGPFRDTLTTSLGCDSFIVLTVTLFHQNNEYRQQFVPDNLLYLTDKRFQLLVHTEIH
ncbi:MAG: hypothetical protein IPL21_12825 [Saprospirales bacterium]|nr:hypothetical protein [Saprospirales bacterium]